MYVEKVLVLFFISTREKWERKQKRCASWVMQSIWGYYESLGEPDMERAEKSTSFLWEVPVRKKKSRYAKE